MKRKFNLSYPRFTNNKLTVKIIGEQGNTILYDAIYELAKGYVVREGTEHDDSYDEVAVYRLDRYFIEHIWEWLESPEFSAVRGNMVAKEWRYDHIKNGKEYTTVITAHFDNGEFLGLAESDIEHITIISQ